MDAFLSGPPVCGLWGMFEADWGDPETPSPYCRITPSRVGSALLPFSCPRCHSTIDFADSTKREHYHDVRPGRDNYWCPTCGNRFKMNTAGQEFNGKLSDGVAPSTIECVSVGSDGMVDYKRTNQTGHFRSYLTGTDVLGCCC